MSLFSGTIDPVAKTFDIADIAETQTSISIINNQLRLSYTSPEGKLVQLVKQLSDAEGISIGDGVTASVVRDQDGVGGFATKTVGGRGTAKALAPVNWGNTSNLTTETFTDNNGVTRVRVLLPVTLH